MLPCRKSSTDALLKLFLTQKRANILIPPRERLDLGTIFVKRGSSVEGLSPGELLTGAIRIVPVDRGEPIDEVIDAVSDKFSVEIGASIAGAVLSAVGLGAAAPDIEAALRASGAATHEVSLAQLEIKALHRATVIEDLAKCLFRPDHPYADGRSTYFLTTATWAASRIVLRSFNSAGSKIELSSDALKALAGGGKIDASVGAGQVTYISSHVPLVFGVETMRVGRKGEGLILLDHRPGLTMRDKDEDGLTDVLALIDPDDGSSAFLNASFSD